MAQVIPEEVNVFYIPHLRMKQLVNVYLEQVNIQVYRCIVICLLWCDDILCLKNRSEVCVLKFSLIGVMMYLSYLPVLV
jgi:hypothetical protein